MRAIFIHHLGVLVSLGEWTILVALVIGFAGMVTDCDAQRWALNSCTHELRFGKTIAAELPLMVTI
jgi:hypothetical protein